ncbi:methyltransferase domain-containing protein [Kitasatospora sp. LaBMicrA B282]|uniref:methyltransferase domain-containing protein n=1 Tax=Kitasatospora sp. LaBMicrA B282 TaxID=3420949 RepID=UPI003D14EEA1
MLEIMDYRRSLERSRASRGRQSGQSTFWAHGREWDLFTDVFAPTDSPSTSVALELLGLTGELPAPTGSLLEIGCGAGVIAVMAALAGCDRVVASDINPAAAHNAAANAARHGVADRLRAVDGDLFAAVPAGERFDTIFWSSNYVMAPESYVYEHVHERAYVDPGYETHRRFLAQAPHWLAPGGRVLLHFSSRGDLATLLQLAEETGRRLQLVGSTQIDDWGNAVEHMLIEITALDSPQAMWGPLLRSGELESGRL